MELSELFRSWEDDLVDEAVTELRHARLKHYISDGEEVTRKRVGLFIERALECFSTRRAQPMVEHAENIARERHAAGYDLSGSKPPSTSSRRPCGSEFYRQLIRTSSLMLWDW